MIVIEINRREFDSSDGEMWLLIRFNKIIIIISDIGKIIFNDFCFEKSIVNIQKASFQKNGISDIPRPDILNSINLKYSKKQEK